jgi:propionyl-CoA synthetase
LKELLKKYAAPGALVVDNYWSTELGSPITSVALGSGDKTAVTKPGAAGFALPGMDVRVVDDEGKEIKRGRQGNIVIKTPLTGTGFRTCWQDEAGFERVLFLGFVDWRFNSRVILIDLEGRGSGLIREIVIPR